MFCIDLVVDLNHNKVISKNPQISQSASFVSAQSSGVHLQSNAFILRTKLKISAKGLIINTVSRRFERSLFTSRNPALLIKYVG